MNKQQLITALNTRRLAIQEAWFKSRAKPGSDEYTAWCEAYGDAAGRYFRACILLDVRFAGI